MKSVARIERVLIADAQDVPAPRFGDSLDRRQTAAPPALLPRR